MHTYLKNLSKILVQTMDGELNITKTIQHVDEEKVNYKFKDVMKNYYPVMLFRRRIKTGVLIKITPMDEQELIFKKKFSFT